MTFYSLVTKLVTKLSYSVIKIYSLVTNLRLKGQGWGNLPCHY